MTVMVRGQTLELEGRRASRDAAAAFVWTADRDGWRYQMAVHSRENDDPAVVLAVQGDSLAAFNAANTEPRSLEALPAPAAYGEWLLINNRLFEPQDAMIRADGAMEVGNPSLFCPQFLPSRPVPDLLTILSNRKSGVGVCAYGQVTLGEAAIHVATQPSSSPSDFACPPGSDVTEAPPAFSYRGDALPTSAVSCTDPKRPEWSRVEWVAAQAGFHLRFTIRVPSEYLPQTLEQARQFWAALSLANAAK